MSCQASPGCSARRLPRPPCMRCCAQAGVAVRAVNAEGLVGLVATQQYKKGDVIMSLPEALAVSLLSTEHTSAVSGNPGLLSLPPHQPLEPDPPAWPQELAFALMALRHRHPDWWASMRPYWDSLPAQGEALREQSFPDELLALLQDESLVRDPPAVACMRTEQQRAREHAGMRPQAAAARAERAFAERLYNGTAPRSYEQGSLAEEFPGLNVSLAEFMHWSSVLGEFLCLLGCQRGGTAQVYPRQEGASRVQGATCLPSRRRALACGRTTCCRWSTTSTTRGRRRPVRGCAGTTRRGRSRPSR